MDTIKIVVLEYISFVQMGTFMHWSTFFVQMGTFMGIMVMVVSLVPDFQGRFMLTVEDNVMQK